MLYFILYLNMIIKIDSANVLINGLSLTDPGFSKYPMLLSLLKFHSLSSTDTEDNVSSSAVAVQISDDDKETEV